jgi:deazaflavin-dependent oxidoreductase (nitroreductase family)
MGVAADIGYEHSPPNVVQRGMQAFASTSFGAKLFSKTITAVDRVVFKLSKGRTTVPEILAGLPVVMVTTTGRKSGQPRTSPLVAVPVGDDLALVGTNFGQKDTPGWVFNLEADPAATVELRGTTVPVRARPATDAERERVFEAAGAIYPGYDKYQQRITGRTIRIFVLERAA